MSILVDYRCSRCEGRSERWVPSPPPPVSACPACGGEARRLFASVGLARSQAGRSGEDGARVGLPSAAGAPKSASLCRQYPQIPGLCHMTESAQKRWVATYRKDNRALEREIASQEAAAETRTPVMSDAISHHHRE